MSHKIEESFSGFRNDAYEETRNKIARARERALATAVAERNELLALLKELIDIEGPQPGTSDWAIKVHAAISKMESKS